MSRTGRILLTSCYSIRPRRTFATLMLGNGETCVTGLPIDGHAVSYASSLQCIIWDNRCTLHAPSAFDDSKERRLMWRYVQPWMA